MKKIKNQQRGSWNGERDLAGGTTWYSVPIKTWVWTDIVTTFYKLGLTEGMSCKLCGKRGTLEHVLSSCNVSLTQGIHRRRHEQVFWELADIPKKEQKKIHQLCERRWSVKDISQEIPGKETHPRFSNFLGDAGRLWVTTSVFPDIISASDIKVWSQ